jgi:hypothetical protein
MRISIDLPSTMISIYDVIFGNSSIYRILLVCHGHHAIIMMILMVNKNNKQLVISCQNVGWTKYTSAGLDAQRGLLL